jgi:hypothetical protein
MPKLLHKQIQQDETIKKSATVGITKLVGLLEQTSAIVSKNGVSLMNYIDFCMHHLSLPLILIDQ